MHLILSSSLVINDREPRIQSKDSSRHMFFSSKGSVCFAPITWRKNTKGIAKLPSSVSSVLTISGPFSTAPSLLTSNNRIDNNNEALQRPCPPSHPSQLGSSRASGARPTAPSARNSRRAAGRGTCTPWHLAFFASGLRTPA